MGMIRTPTSLKVKKRDGRIVPFNSDKIKNAVQKAFKEAGVENDLSAAEYIERKITNYVLNDYLTSYVLSDYLGENIVVDIENIQDWVEYALMDFDKKAAKAYIKERFYRDMEHRFYHLFRKSEVKKI